MGYDDATLAISSGEWQSWYMMMLNWR